MFMVDRATEQFTDVSGCRAKGPRVRTALSCTPFHFGLRPSSLGSHSLWVLANVSFALTLMALGSVALTTQSLSWCQSVHLRVTGRDGCCETDGREGSCGLDRWLGEAIGA